MLHGSPETSLRSLLVAAIAALALTGCSRADLDDWVHLQAPVAFGEAVPGERVTATFLGVSTVLLSDGETSLLTDGFFSRPGLLKVVVGKVAPDSERIGAALARAGIGELAAVAVVHSHYDHSMDAPEVARRTGAVLLGSESTANVGRGWDLPEEQIRVVEPGRRMPFGRFGVTFLESRHVDFGTNRRSLGGVIAEPLVPPARALDYAEGGSYSILIDHPLGGVLVQGSAGFVEGALEGRRADVVLLGVGGLGRMDDAYRQAYLENVVDPLSPSRVAPIHWDDFTRSLERPLAPFPRAFDDFDALMADLQARVERRPDLELVLLPPGEPTQLFPRP